MIVGRENEGQSVKERLMNAVPPFSTLQSSKSPQSKKSPLSKHRLSLLAACCVAATLIAGCHPALAQVTLPEGGSAVLPVPQAQFRGVIGRKASESTPDFPKDVTAPKGAPNVLLIMTDDTVLVPPVLSADRFRRRRLIAWRRAAWHTTSSTPPHFVRQHALRFLPAATIRALAWATSRSSPQDILGTRR
jgi:hypothetical protein